MTPDEVRAAVRSWPELLGDRLRDFLADHWDDESVDRLVEIVAYVTTLELTPLDAALDFSDAMTAKLEAILNYVHTMEEHPMTDTPNEPTPVAETPAPPQERERRRFKPVWTPPPPPWFDGPPDRGAKDPNALVIVDETQRKPGGA